MFFDELYLAFILTSALFIVTPGPNVALIVSNSLAYDSRYGATTVAGVSSAMIFQITLTLLGMTALLTIFSHVFEWVRWIGVAYLLYIGFQKFFTKADDLSKVKKQPKSLKFIFWQGFIVSILNPKTMLFYSAFFPQFVRPEYDVGSQFAVLGVTFFLLALTLDMSWVLLARYVKPFMLKFNHFYERISGGFLILAGLGLALARKT
ncbi:MAG: LysE family translocator [Alphaproteobacteria bacterium]|nr:LysE family translocator [Alphaproteobacteria bacterium]